MEAIVAMEAIRTDGELGRKGTGKEDEIKR